MDSTEKVVTHKTLKTVLRVQNHVIVGFVNDYTEKTFEDGNVVDTDNIFTGLELDGGTVIDISGCVITPKEHCVEIGIYVEDPKQPE